MVINYGWSTANIFFISNTVMEYIIVIILDELIQTCLSLVLYSGGAATMT